MITSAPPGGETWLLIQLYYLDLTRAESHLNTIQDMDWNIIDSGKTEEAQNNMFS